MITLCVVGAGLAIVVQAFYSGSETGAYCVNRARLQVALDRKRRHAETVAGLIRAMPTLIATTLVGTNLAAYVSSGLVTHCFEEAGLHHAEVVATLVLAPILFVFAELTPKTIFARNADSLFYVVSPLLKLSNIVFRPATVFLEGVGGFWKRVLGPSDAEDDMGLSHRRLRFLFQAGTSEGVLTDYQRTLAENVMTLRDIRLERVMVPWDSVRTVNADETVCRAKKTVAGGNFSRTPVVDDSGNVVGVVHILDLFLDADDDDHVRRWAHQAPAFTPDTPVLNALYDLQRGESLLGIVRDRDGDQVGIVTAKNLVEEICGELVAW